MTFRRYTAEPSTKKIKRADRYIENPEARECWHCHRPLAADEPIHLLLDLCRNVTGWICLDCGQQHKREQRNERLRHQRAAKRDVTGSGAGERECQSCGEQFTASRSDHLYCSPRCRQRARRAA